MSSAIPGAVASAPPFQPTFFPENTPSSLSVPTSGWIDLLVSSCHFGRAVFLSTLKDLCLHPERNSSLILRADPLPPRPINPSDTPEGFEPVEEVHVRLMPRQPKRDGRLEQRCLFFRADPDPVTGKKEEGMVMYLPQVRNRAELPFYYPAVKGLAYRWEAVEPDLEAVTTEPTSGETAEEGFPVLGKLTISYLPWPDEGTGLPDTDTSITPAPPACLSPERAHTPKRRSPLAAPPIDANGQVESEEISAPAVVLHPVAHSQARRSPERIARICHVLLETVYKHGFGRVAGYKKRVNHDIIVQREPFQDLYLTLKERHRHLDSRAPKPGSTSTKVEDVKRHVFKGQGLPDDPLLPASFSNSSFTMRSLVDLSEWGEQDVAIAAFLMLLWKGMYPSRKAPERSDGETGEEWDTWGRPPGGFVDLGCGNGLLVHVLTAEGYHGKGYELRKRRTWPAYPPETQANLIELPIDFPSWFPSTLDEWTSGSWSGKESCMIKEDCFVVGNHADEITPWIPLLSLIPSTPVPFLSLPCCAHTLDDHFTHSIFNPPPHPHSPLGGFDQGLEQGQSRYKAYLMYLGWTGLKCGWEWEKEGMRVPSTRGWGIVGRKRWAITSEQILECREWALEQVQQVRARGAFKVRVKEGKDH